MKFEINQSIDQRADNQLPDDGWLVYRFFLQAAASSRGGGTTDRERFGAELICSSLKCIKNNAPLLQAVWHALWRRQSTEDLPLKVFQAFNSSMKNRLETAGNVEFCVLVESRYSSSDGFSLILSVTS